jgi:hypothetical protein
VHRIFIQSVTVGSTLDKHWSHSTSARPKLNACTLHAATGVSDLRRRVDDLLATETTHAGNARLLKHLGKESGHLFTFLERDGVEATNWKGEQAIRPAVVNRKSWGGNVTWAGADTQEVLSSVLATARAQGKDPISVLVPLLRSPTPRLADLILPGVGEGEWRQVPEPAQLARPARAP